MAITQMTRKYLEWYGGEMEMAWISAVAMGREKRKETIRESRMQDKTVSPISEKSVLGTHTHIPGGTIIL